MGRIYAALLVLGMVFAFIATIIPSERNLFIAFLCVVSAFLVSLSTILILTDPSW